MFLSYNCFSSTENNNKIHFNDASNDSKKNIFKFLKNDEKLIFRGVSKNNNELFFEEIREQESSKINVKLGGEKYIKNFENSPFSNKKVANIVVTKNKRSTLSDFIPQFYFFIKKNDKYIKNISLLLKRLDFSSLSEVQRKKLIIAIKSVKALNLSFSKIPNLLILKIIYNNKILEKLILKNVDLKNISEKQLYMIRSSLKSVKYLDLSNSNIKRKFLDILLFEAKSLKKLVIVNVDIMSEKHKNQLKKFNEYESDVEYYKKVRELNKKSLNELKKNLPSDVKIISSIYD